MSRRTALLLVDFDATRNEQMMTATSAESEIISMYAKKGEPCPFRFIWSIGTGPQLNDISNVTAVFDAMNISKCDTIFCCVCDQEIPTYRVPLYAYIRELARLCHIDVITMKDVHIWHETHGPNGEEGPEMLIGDPGPKGPEGVK